MRNVISNSTRETRVVDVEVIQGKSVLRADSESVVKKPQPVLAQKREETDYLTYSRPGLGKLLKAIRVDVKYHKADGCYLYYKNGDKDVPVLDIMAGYGACLFGHNYQPFIDTYQKFFLEKRPFLAQASERENTGLLGRKLDELLFRVTEKNYISLTFSTGAESAEAAIKYADFQRKKITTQLWDRFKSVYCDSKAQLESHVITLDPKLAAKLSDFYGVYPDKPTVELLESWHEQVQKQLFTASSINLSLKKSYHGKTTGALQITHGESFRLPFENLGPRAAFIDQSDPVSLENAINENSLTVLMPVIDGDVLTFSEEKLNLISALFIEPIQGEGGVRPVSVDFLNQCRAAATENDFLLVFDEIQCGMGRTGTFLHSEQQGVTADIYLFSKSLGGGLTKISVTSIVKDKYDITFDQIHSSTFAEDDFSTGIALCALNELENNPFILSNIKNQGAHLLEGLSKIKSQYPNAIKEVRGVGLMLGLELENQSGRDSYVFKVLSEAKLLGHVIAGYMLREHQVRVAATMSDNFVIRIQPPALINREECDYLLRAIEDVANILERANGYELCKYLVNLESDATDSLLTRTFRPIDEVDDYRGRNNGTPSKIDPNVKSVTFVGTPPSALVMAEGETSFTQFSTRQLIQFFDQVCELLGPVELQTSTIQSATGEKINFRLVGIMYEPHYVVRNLRENNVSHMVADVNTELQDAIQRQDQSFGLGTYTSIFTNNGKTLSSDKISITTGNALTVGMGFRGLLKAANEKQIQLETATLGVLGAGGNIGTVYSELLADYVPALVLFGREDRLDRLYEVTYKIYQNAALDIPQEKYLPSSIAAKLKDTQTWQLACDEMQTSGSSDIGKFIYDKLIEEFGDNIPIKVTSDTQLLSSVNLLLTASNAPKPIVYSHMLGSHDTVVCDVAVPQDIDDSVVQDCPNVNLIRGGLCRMPNNPEVGMLGSYVIGHGVAYACMVETMLMGFESFKGHGSYGPISKPQVYKFLNLADLHGFKLESVKVTNPFNQKET
ncbi:MAG: acetylornithine/succinyldiaminopimelate/putrescine aminotransferase [Arenicella sp.]|jgi:acetylornithine/succinyldiaminopimelate/putrescine aminotransferase/predicted amino acid dehydrogenase